jgi:hypothetical protein
VISTSLHGLIVSHSYGIPALWISFKEKDLFGDNIKFLDYFSSVKIPEYSPFKFLEIKSFETEQVIQKIVEHPKLGLPQENLSTLQQGLIKAAPFYIKEEFRYK